MRECDFILARSDTGAGQPDGELGRVRTTDDDDALYRRETKARREDGEYGRLCEGAEGRNSRGTHGHSLH